jgi:DNA-binding MarR family transcriptional regulator
MHPNDAASPDQIRRHIHQHLEELFGIEDSSSIELFAMLQRAAHSLRLHDAQHGDEFGLSGPRWGLLLRLLIEEEQGNHAGITPTTLSESQRVSKNTISALLRGLEAQGLIRRMLDATDLRAFRIQLTDAGRDYIRTDTPQRVENLNRLLTGLSRAEQEQLIVLLEKLQHSLRAGCEHPQGDPNLACTSLDQECFRP